MSAAAAAFVLLCASPSQSAPSNPANDIPDIGSRRNTLDPSVLTGDCTLLPGDGTRHVRCTFAQAMLSRPSATTTAKHLADIDGIDAKHLAEALRSACAGKGPKDADPGSVAPEVEYIAKLRSACALKDPEGIRKALRWQETEVEAKTCSLTAHTFTEDFQQVDADTWTSASNARGICNLSILVTLWRPHGDRMFWNYKQVRSVPPNMASNPFCKLDTTSEFSSLPTVRETQCVYFR